jgi:hypothetical protein
MKPFEFVLVIISVIVGLALTEFAIGVSYMIINYERANFYWPYIVLMLCGLMSCLNYWATVYKLRKVQTWTVSYIGIVFLSGLIFFIMTRIYFPNPDKFDQDYQRYFHENVRTIFVLMICFVISFILEAVVIRKVRGFKKFGMMIAFILVILSGVIVRNDFYVNILTIVILLMQTIYYSRTGNLVADQET